MTLFHFESFEQIACTTFYTNPVCIPILFDNLGATDKKFDYVVAISRGKPRHYLWECNLLRTPFHFLSLELIFEEGMKLASSFHIKGKCIV